MAPMTHLTLQPFLPRPSFPPPSPARPPSRRWPTGNHARVQLPGIVPAEVFAFLCDVDRLSEWNGSIVEVVARPPSMTPGAVWKVLMRDGALRWVSRSTLVEADRFDHVLVYRSGTDDGNESYAEWRWSVRATASGSVLDVHWSLHPRSFLRRHVLAPYRERRLRREVPASLARLAAALGAHRTASSAGSAAAGRPVAAPARPAPEPAPMTMLGIWAHPDDEAYLSAALMLRVVAGGGRVVVVTATLGEAGLPGTEPEAAKAVRRRELVAALAAVGVTDLHVLGLPDGACEEQDEREVVARLEQLMLDVRPDLVVTFGPDGITGHPDHRAVSRWTMAAWQRAGLGELRLATMTESFSRTHRELHDRIGLALDGPLQPVPDADVVLRVVPTPVELTGKRRALEAHRSQTAPLVELIGARAFRSWWVEECFREATAEELSWAAASQLEEVGT